MLKKLGLILAILMASMVTYGQELPPTKRTVNNYYPAYVQDTPSMAVIGKHNFLVHKNFDVEIFLIDHPVLDSIQDFRSNVKYSLINTKLCTSPPTETAKKIEYNLVNGKKYVVKKDKILTPNFKE